MLKQGVVQEKISDLTAMNQLPPLSTLPQWSRVNTLDRGRYPKPFVKDKLQTIQDRPDTGEEDDKQIDLSQLNPAQRIHHLERSIIFLKQQHQEVLKSLHDEIEGLKKENKEDKLDELKIIFLEEEIKELKHALRETRNRNTYLTQVLEQAEDAKKKQQHTIEALKYQLSQGNAASVAEQIVSGNNIFNQPGRPPPTLAECEGIIRHLQQINEKQQHELDQLKADLRDVLYSHKWTPDAYLLARAYIADDDAKEHVEGGSEKNLPRLPFKNPMTRKLPEVAYIQQDAMTLPALKQTVSNKAMERRKRTQILQKARLKKEVT
ncbi:hypothetical protein ACJMK2_010944 [Sinanodonta woodiana]|uniref:Coiled-coil domain-containing protein 74B n=1 Tax=Sinanodonta woodiana TaxID=1069815 RepID=A0ABD3V3C7_SINWO